MATGRSVKTSQKRNKKNRTNKIYLVFDEAKRREFLTGFHKRNLQRKKAARERLERRLKEERKRLKNEVKEAYRKLVVSHRPIPELETLLKEEYEEDGVTVRIEELSMNTIAKQSNWIGVNQARYETTSDNAEEEIEEMPGMELTVKKKKQEEKITQKFDSERHVKRLLKKEATKRVKKSKVFQIKNRIERNRQKKKSLQMQKQNTKHKEKKSKKHH